MQRKCDAKEWALTYDNHAMTASHSPHRDKSRFLLRQAARTTDPLPCGLFCARNSSKSAGLLTLAHHEARPRFMAGHRHPGKCNPARMSRQAHPPGSATNPSAGDFAVDRLMT